MLFAADQVAGTLVPCGVMIVAVPSGENMMLFVTPLACTCTVWPAISDPGVHTGWAIAPATGTTAAAPKMTNLDSDSLDI